MKKIMKYKIKLKCDDDFYWSLILHILDSDFTWKEVAPVNSNSTKNSKKKFKDLGLKELKYLKMRSNNSSSFFLRAKITYHVMKITTNYI